MFLSKDDYRRKWDMRFMAMAELVASWSRDPSTQVGAIITRGKYLVSTGYNGFPQGVQDSVNRYTDRETKYKYIIHGEVNAILTSKQNLEGCTLYTVPFPPCIRCAGIVIQSGITRIVSWYEGLTHERWAKDFKEADVLYSEAGVTLDVLSKVE